MKKIVVALAALALLTAACAPGIGASGAVPKTLNISGSSQVELTPDIAYVSIGVRTEASDVSSAVSRNADTVDRVMSLLAESGIAPEDMRTSNFSVYSVDEYDNLGQREGFNYFVDNTVNVTVRDLPGLGDLLDDVRAPSATVGRLMQDGVNSVGCVIVNDCWITLSHFLSGRLLFGQLLDDFRTHSTTVGRLVDDCIISVGQRLSNRDRLLHDL